MELDETNGRNIDQDTVPTDEHAILLEGSDYYFTCTVPAGEADPEANIRWRLFKSDGSQIGSDQEDSSGETQTDCQTNEFSAEFHLDAADVTFANLQCGYVECEAYSSVDSVGTSAPVRITFQIWSKSHP